MTDDQARIITREFPEATVPAGISTYLFIQAKDPFTPESFSMPEDIARNFLITDIKVGANSQFISTGCIPALLFSDKAIVENLRLDHLSIQVKNISDTSCNFQGAFVGEAVALDGYYKQS